MIICKDNGKVELSGSPDEILSECADVFVCVVFLAHEETDVPIGRCFEQTFDLMGHYIKMGIAARLTDN